MLVFRSHSKIFSAFFVNFWLSFPAITILFLNDTGNILFNIL